MEAHRTKGTPHADPIQATNDIPDWIMILAGSRIQVWLVVIGPHGRVPSVRDTFAPKETSRLGWAARRLTDAETTVGYPIPS